MTFPFASFPRASRARDHIRRVALLALAGASVAAAIVACSTTELVAADAGTSADAGDATDTADATSDLDASDSGDAERPRVLVYANGCTPDVCGAPPSGREAARCWKGDTGAGACAWSRPIVTASDSGGVSPPAPCETGACGAEPAPIACAPGYAASAPACSRMDNPACEWRHVCAPAPTEEACEPRACGPQSADAVYCETPDGGVSASRACRKTGLGDCTWQLVCPAGSVPPR